MKRISKLRAFMLLPLLLATVAIVGSGCVVIPQLAFHNNTSRAVTVCNLGLAKDGCVTVKANRAVRMSLSTDGTVAGASLFSVSNDGSSKQYNFAGRHLSQLHSGYCGSPLSRGCDIAVRLDSDDLIYWVNPSGTSVSQPDGFPIAPNSQL